MKYLFAILILVSSAASASAQIMLRISPTLQAVGTPINLRVGQYDEYDVTLNANTHINWDVPVIAGGVYFRVKLCENSTGGFAPVYGVVQSGITLVNRINGLTILSTAANYCETQYWSYNQLTKQIILEGTSPPAPSALDQLPINALPTQTGNYKTWNFLLQDVGCPANTQDALAEGCAIGATTPAAITSTDLTADGTVALADASGTGASNSSGVRVNGHTTPFGYSGADICAQIQAAENWCKSSQTLNTCDIDASQIYLGKTYNCTNRIVLSVPTHLEWAGNIDYTGAGNAAGVIEFATGSDGSELNCHPSGLDQNDPNYNFGEGGSNNFTKQVACSVSAEFSSFSGQPVVAIDSGVSRIHIHDLNVQGNNSTSDGLLNAGQDGTVIERVSFTHERPGGVASNPTGWAIDSISSSLPQNATKIMDNVMVGWGQGIKASRTGSAGNVGDTITGNIEVLMGGQELFINNLAASVIQANQFLSMFPATTNVNKIEFGAGTNQNLLYQANHSECDNQTHQLGIVELAVDAGTFRSNSFINNSMHGNAGCNSSNTYDPDHLIDWQATAGWNNVISGNDFANALNGAINLVASAPVSVYGNNVKAPLMGETPCAAEPGPGAGCLLTAASALPLRGQEFTPLHFSGVLGGLTSTASATLLQDCTTAENSGALMLLTEVTDLDGGTCTTAPTYNIRDNTQGTTGTAKAASTSAGQVTQAETLTYSAGDQICLVRTVNGGTCTTPFFSVSAQALRID